MDATDRLVENINHIIKERGLKQRYLAENMQIDERRLSAILTRRTKNVTATDIGKFCIVLDVNPNELFGIG